MIKVLTFLALGLLTILLSYLGVANYSKWAVKKQILDIPNQRSSHTAPIPRGGGVVIVALTLGGLSFYQIFEYSIPWAAFLGLITGALLISGLSWWDDLHSLPVGIRLAIQSLAAIVALAVLGCWHTVTLPVIGRMHLGLLGLPLAFIWIVGLTNAYNFMDGIDGIAAGQAIIAGLGWFILGWISNQTVLMVLSLLLSCANLGFIAHNWAPARIFMGDVGSAFLGYAYAILPLLANYCFFPGGWDGSFLAGILFIWPFLLDTIFTFLRRLASGDNVFCAHRTHIYQRLVIAGYSSCFVSLLYMGLSFIAGIVVLFWSAPSFKS